MWGFVTVVITGSPGVGKHTTSSIVSDMCNMHVLDLNKLAMKHGMTTPAGDTSDADVDAMYDMLDDMIRHIDKPEPLVVGHLAPYVMPRDGVRMAVVLRRNPYVLESTYMQRRYPRKKMLDNIQSEILGTILYDASKWFGSCTVQMDTSTNTAQYTAGRIARCASGDVTHDDIDWLGLVNEKGDMDRFFPTR